MYLKKLCFISSDFSTDPNRFNVALFIMIDTIGTRIIITKFKKMAFEDVDMLIPIMNGTINAKMKKQSMRDENITPKYSSVDKNSKLLPFMYRKVL